MKTRSTFFWVFTTGTTIC